MIVSCCCGDIVVVVDEDGDDGEEEEETFDLGQIRLVKAEELVFLSLLQGIIVRYAEGVETNDEQGYVQKRTTDI